MAHSEQDREQQIMKHPSPSCIQQLQKILFLTACSVAAAYSLLPGIAAADAQIPATESLQTTHVAVKSNTGATPLLNAHAHNDYLHQRPLLDAMSYGFTSIEADVFLIDGQLLVAHTMLELSPMRSLEELYLKPLADMAARNNGQIYKDGPTLTLLIDIKMDGKAAFAALDQLLAKYDPLISQSIDGNYTQRAITVIISGDRPVKEIEQSNPRRAGIDGRLSDLESDLSHDLLPLISDKWTSHFRFRGDGNMSPAEQQKLKDIVEKTHAKGRRLRFWATPENTDLWRTLRAAGVDLIGTDDLKKLSNFLRQDAEKETPE